jgi:antitoxin (DNA-binding transcriptional repressor) of toxin-antitoxin stability system
MEESTTLTKTINVQENQPQWNELLSWILAGTEIIFTEGSRPLARLLPIPSATSPRQPGLHAGAIWTSPDFDQPLPDEF